MQCVQVLSGLALGRVLASTLDSEIAIPRAATHDEILAASSQHAARALRQANARAWFAIEILLAGEAFWERAQLEWERRLEETLFRPLRSFLDRTPPGPLFDLDGAERNRLRQNLAECLDSGTLTTGGLDPRELLQVAPDARNRPTRFEAEWRVLRSRASDPAWLGSAEITRLLELQDAEGASLLVSLVAALFRHAVLADADLFGKLGEILAQESLNDKAKEFAAWAAALEAHRSRLESLLQRPSAMEVPVAPRIAEVSSQTRLQRGRGHAQRGEYEAAIAEFTAVIQQDPALASAHAERGDAYRLCGEYSQAVSDYSTALRLDPGNRAALLNRGHVYWLLRKFPEAIADLSALIQMEPAHPVAHHYRGKAHLDAGNFRAAVVDFSEAQRLAPTSPWPCHDRGDAYAALEEYERAIADYTESLRLNPQGTLSYVRRGEAHATLKAYDQAIRDFSQALHLDPLNATAYRCRGTVYRELGQYDQATSDFTRALELNEDDADVFYQRGLVFNLRGDHERAVDDLDTAIRLDPKNAGLYFQRGQAVAALGNVPLALADFSEAIRLAPANVDAFISRGLLYASRGDNDQALSDYSSALRIQPTCAQAYAHRARVRMRMGLLDDAVADCDSAIEHAPELLVAYIVRATARAQRGQFQEAVNDLTRALSLDPTHLHAFFLRGVANAKSGRLAPAVADFSSVIRLDPKNARAFAQRALALREAGQHGHAVSDMAHAARLNRRYLASYMEQLALFHTVQGEHERAVADYAVALHLSPKNEEYRQAKEKAWLAFQERAKAAREETPTGKPRRRITVTMSAMPVLPALETSTDMPVIPDSSGPEVPHLSPASESVSPDDTSVEITTSEATAESAPIPLPAPIESQGETDFEFNPDTGGAEDTPAPPMDAHDDVTVVSEEDPTPAASLGGDAAPGRAQLGEGSPSPPAEVHESPTSVSAESSVPPDDDEARAREQSWARAQEEDRKAKLAEAVRRQEEEKRAKEEAEKRKKERDKRKKRADDDDDPNRLPLWKKGMLAAAASIALWFIGTLGYGFVGDMRSRAPVSLPSLCKDFAADPNEARKKYDGGVFELTGKAKFVKTAQGERLALESAQVPDWAVHCRFDMPAKVYKKVIADTVKEGAEITIVGRCSYQPKEGKGVILLDDCELRKGS